MTAPSDLAAHARELTKDWSPEAKAEFAAKVRAKARRLRTIRECPTPLDLACRFDHTFIRTPALQLISERLRDTLRERDGRLVISVAPQQGKSSQLRWAILWALLDDPDRRIVLASYAAGLARTSGRIVRGMIETHGQHIGLEVSRSHADAADWELEGFRGGLFSTGRGAMTGRPADVAVLDDTLKDAQEANSPVILNHLHEWFDSVVRTRLAPGAPLIVVATRWTEKDLSGRFIDEGWPLINIPAVSDGKTPDALDRPPGEWLISARGTTPEDWERTRRDVGERTWNALYMGRPVPLEGGVFKSNWFDLWRVDELPAGCSPPIVVVDPADNPGSGDEAGIVVGAAHPGTRKGYMIDDLSAAMTVGRWARVASLACARYKAPTLAFERSLSQLPNRIRETWDTLYQQALALKKADGDVDAAVTRLSRSDDSDDVRDRLRMELAEIVADYPLVLDMGPAGPRVKPIHAKGSKLSRMQLIASAFETGRMALVGQHRAFEFQASTWQEGQESPDRVDAGTYLAALLTNTSGIASLGRADDRVPTRSTSRARATNSRITRSTRR